jgi:diketogulonate reductase-like aldo/keto reductase
MNLILNNGVQMPALGFGVFQTPPDVTADAVHAALQTGYRLIDTAAYGNILSRRSRRDLSAHAAVGPPPSAP